MFHTVARLTNTKRSGFSTTLRAPFTYYSRRQISRSTPIAPHPASGSVLGPRASNARLAVPHAGIAAASRHALPPSRSRCAQHRRDATHGCTRTSDIHVAHTPSPSLTVPRSALTVQSHTDTRVAHPLHTRQPDLGYRQGGLVTDRDRAASDLTDTPPAATSLRHLHTPTTRPTHPHPHTYAHTRLSACPLRAYAKLVSVVLAYPPDGGGAPLTKADCSLLWLAW